MKNATPDRSTKICYCEKAGHYGNRLESAGTDFPKPEQYTKYYWCCRCNSYFSLKFTWDPTKKRAHHRLGAYVANAEMERCDKPQKNRDCGLRYEARLDDSFKSLFL